jgi:lysozyme family protein
LKTIAEMIDDVIRREGGYVNHPADRGGPTKYGITQKALSAWLEGLPKNIRDLTEDMARTIYDIEYYLKPKINHLPPSIRPFVFDAAVNHGPTAAIRMLQGVLLDAGHDPGPIDGIIGPRTITAAERYDRQFLDQLIERRKLFYEGIVARDESQRVFLAGWMNRLNEFRG